MRGLYWALAGGLALAMIATSGMTAEKKKAPSNKEKIVGAWEVTKTAAGNTGDTVEYFKNGKFKHVGKNVTFEGAYTIDDTTITLRSQLGDKTIGKIKKLTDTEMTIENDKGELVEFKKK